MKKDLKHNFLARLGLLSCVILNGVGFTLIWMGGLHRDQTQGPLGRLMMLIASYFTEAPSMISAGSDRMELTWTLFLCCYALFSILFTSLYWIRTNSARRQSPVANAAILAAQLLIAVLVDPMLLYPFAAELGFVLPLRAGMKWLVTQMLLYIAQQLLLYVNLTIGDELIKYFLISLSINLVFFVFAYGVAYVAVLEREGRIRLSAAHAELVATQTLLSDTVRSSERMRIARDLHDAVGHHLTALNLHLDLALRHSGGNVHESLTTSRELAHSMLTKIRGLVSTERRGQSINLRQAIETLCSGIPVPPIQLEFDSRFDVNSPAIAHALFCCVQEGLSNAMRHASAKRIIIQFDKLNDKLHVLIADDGDGNCGAPEGNGLRGMRERLTQLGGTLVAANRLQRGFGIEITVPAIGGVQ